MFGRRKLAARRDLLEVRRVFRSGFGPVRNHCHGPARRDSRAGRAGRTIEIDRVVAALVRVIASHQGVICNRGAVAVERRQRGRIEGR